MPQPQTRLLIRNETVFCNGDAVTEGEDLATIKAWQTLAQQHHFARERMQKTSKNKGLSTIHAEVLDGSADLPSITKNKSLYEAYCFGWLLLQ